jgi:protein subunit release factor A
MIPKRDIKFEYTKGQGPGGQHKNKTETCVKATHIPTGITVRIDGRKRNQNKKRAVTELEKRVHAAKQKERAFVKKARRDKKIKEGKYIRTYDFKRNEVKDHRTGKVAPLKEILEDARLDLLR